ncbi:hypothetical protein X848_gp09 [Edwardsiella phage PEi21]|uniref:Uncharacterized protein n=1 Tax=Edwardsiella phage PEi21 TaxID=1325372 RepID=N0DQN9_9CAUD|nr:hypothetical protein X848_gp09 [Edwardsiella phage PEi21]QXV72949.1 hypothetical protein [Edwardsiella phage PVN06]BAN16819.1 hypothetical protein [Edwardsiella phage PEi21]
MSARTPTYNGTVCLRGHTERYVATGKCVECDRMRKRASYARNAKNFNHPVMVFGNPNRTGV